MQNFMFLTCEGFVFYEFNARFLVILDTKKALLTKNVKVW